jgi:hypothetical protein
MSKVKTKEMRDRLRKLMDDNDLNSVKVADLTLYKPQTIRAMMCGQRDVSPRVLKLLEMQLN